jgi:DNA-binding MarR family transcriptional regulator
MVSLILFSQLTISRLTFPAESWNVAKEDCVSEKEPESTDHLLAHVCHFHFDRARSHLHALGLYRGQPQMLKALWKKEGQTQGELAECLHVQPATITRMLQRMERAGFVERQPDPEDQRISRVSLTPAGRAIQSDVQQVWRTLEQETFAGFTAEEKAQLHRFLLQMRENLLRVSEGNRRP